MDIKDFLYRWCAKNKYAKPFYATNNNDDNNKLIAFKAEVRVCTKLACSHDKGSCLREFGFGCNQKMARTEAAINICRRLIENGIMDESQMIKREVEKVNSVTCSRPNAAHIAVCQIHENNESEQSFTENRLSKTESSKMDFTKKVEPCLKRSVDETKETELSIGQILTNVIEKRSSETPSRKKQRFDDSVSIQKKHDQHHLDTDTDISKLKNYNSAEDFRPGSLESLDDQLWSHYRLNKQPDWLYSLKCQLTSKMTMFLRDNLHRSDIKLVMVGSSVTGLGSYNADLDLCLVALPMNGFDPIDRDYCISMLKILRRLMYRFCSKRCQAIELIPAKVPILRIIEYSIDEVTFDIDINVNNATGIRNSHLLHYYSLANERFPALALAIKHWAIKADICDAKNGMLSSYALALMLLHFLLAATDPPVLPNLQQQIPEWFDSFPYLTLWERLPSGIMSPFDGNVENLGSLLLKFFDYYANKVDFEKDAFSVCSGSKFSRSLLPKSTEQYFIFVEEPFDGTNVARCVLEAECYLKIRNSFRLAYKNLKETLQLTSIHVII